jgi:hypothetical protein
MLWVVYVITEAPTKDLSFYLYYYDSLRLAFIIVRGHTGTSMRSKHYFESRFDFLNPENLTSRYALCLSLLNKITASEVSL